MSQPSGNAPDSLPQWAQAELRAFAGFDKLFS
jgi:hypothetical protein